MKILSKKGPMSGRVAIIALGVSTRIATASKVPALDFLGLMSGGKLNDI
jgi:hypothetical protein